MKHATRIALVLGSSCIFVSATFGQSTSTVARPLPTPSAMSRVTCSTTVGPMPGMASSAPTAPYSAVRESSNVQTLADGTHISHKPTSEKIYRDSQGRLRTERSLCQGPSVTSDALVIEILDPVSGYSYILDEQNHIAHRFALQVRHPLTPPVPTTNTGAVGHIPTSVVSRQASRPDMNTESLGTQTMESVLVEGTRTTQVIPEGSLGNDRPITIVSEIWTSPDLEIIIFTKSNDPRYGEMTMRLTNIELSNPILSLFQPPPDYKVVDEIDRVTLTYTHN
jgi:hypothetical protein